MLLSRIIVSKKVARDGASGWVNIVARSSRQTSDTKASSVTTSVGETTALGSNSEIILPAKRGVTKVQKINKAMQAYLERAQKHEHFLRKQGEDFSLGKRHLANMMGWDPENITQQDIDNAIAYLLPSGLFEPLARPMMKPPEQIFSREKAAEFDYTGRPFHYLFYTTKPYFYGTLHDAVTQMTKLNKHESRMIKMGHRCASEKSKIKMQDTRWLTKEELEALLVEDVTDEQYEYFIRTMTRLAEHPYSLETQGFILKYRKELVSNVSKQNIEPLKHDEAGNPYSEARGKLSSLSRLFEISKKYVCPYSSGRKGVIAKVTVRGNGTGRFTINHCISASEYFAELKDRIQLMFPLQFTGLLNKVDVEATIFHKTNVMVRNPYYEGEKELLTEDELLKLEKPLARNEGLSSEAGAIRHGVAKALCSFVTEEDIKMMRLAGLLTRDPRMKERLKPGQAGARRKFTWRKR
ncbi:28S ribosomal protein S9 [Tropilaelaps mercedesae]|uniref:28S ribosomal protein S9 n=1 Tax=Tropilaelaps mercedesae TaxID=418985 RepID=A0A1V9XTF5_9ACAR|nr:28S ribosomal protein S9 [Tropilaelaps mercedesae]